MGKSLGKWIKTVLFGKKSSKSSSQKKTGTTEKEEAASAAAASKTPSFGNMGDGEKTENGLTVNLANEVSHEDVGKSICLGSPNDNSTTVTEQQEQAVVTPQAIFRGYLARRSAGAIKGLIRLQALVRGHLVRRQAISTLRCVQGIVRLQALSRGIRVRVSDVGREVWKKCSSLDCTRVELSRPNKLSSNAFICKLLASSHSTAMPLQLHYDKMEPNFTWQWLERWSSSKFWEPLPQLKNNIDKKSNNKKGNIQTKKAELGRQKKVEGWVPTLDNRKLSSNHSPAYENPQINNTRKLETKEKPAGQEQPKNELERVKQNLRRISASSKVVLACSESVVETPKLTPKMVSSSPTSDVAEKIVAKAIEKTIDPLSVEVSKTLAPNSQGEMPLKTVTTEQKFDKPCDAHVIVEKHPSEYVEKVEDVAKGDEERIYKEDKSLSMDFEVRSYKRNLPGKLEYPEFVPPKSPSLPNYMAATESAKAKLRGFSSPRFDQEYEAENGGFTRRHSLPLCTDHKFTLTSSQNERLVQASARVSRSSPLSSINGHGKGARPGWRR